MLSLDTEDDSKGNPTIINFFDGAKHFTFTGKNLRWNALDWLNKQGKKIVWCCNTEYDLINLFGSEWIGRLVTLQYVGAGFMRAFCKECPVTFYDTLRHWPASVKTMGEYIGLKKLEKDFTSVIYCRRDAEIVWRFVDEMLRRYDNLGLALRSTLPSMAMQLFLKFYPKENIEPLPQNATEMFRQAYFGGRVEVYQFGKVKGPINHYDVNSLFPSVMLGGKFPRLHSWRATRSPDLSLEGVVEAHARIPDMYFPPLPVRTSEEIMFPIGTIHGTWTYAEARRLIELGGKIEPVKAIEFRETESPFDTFIEFCYRKRLESMSELDRLLWKLMMNSLYGKFAQSKGIISIHWSRKSRGVIQTEISGESKLSNVIWSAYTTSYARLKLLDYLTGCSKVFYTDTDSIFTPDMLETSIELGKLKKEGEYKQAEFVGSKLYVLDDRAKAKGVNQEVAKDFIRTGRAVFRRPARFRESLKTFAQANVWYQVEKHLEKRYTKRKIVEGGETEPWNYREYKSWLRHGAARGANQLNFTFNR